MKRTKASGSVRSEPHAAPVPYRWEQGVLTLRLHVQPGAKRTGWSGGDGAGSLRLRVAAPPLEGRANRACVVFLAGEAGVPAAQVSIVRGDHGREKTIRIQGVALERFERLREQWGC